MTSEEYDKLTDEEKRIKVAELCEYRDISRGLRMEYKDGYVYDIPDYLNDLNACHEFESFTDPGLGDKYDSWLETVTRRTGFKWHATAEQRCKAFVLTMENSR